MSETDAGSSYLGLPNAVGRSKKSVLGFLKDRMLKRIRSWDNKLLSRAGKEILLKTMVQSLPTFAMSVFLIPMGMCREIEVLMNKFWWSSNPTTGRGICWRSWKGMMTHEYAGGMGFRSMRDFNLAMLGKQGWRILTKPESLVARVFKARYFPNGDFLTAHLGPNPSFIWRSVRESQSLLQEVLRRRIGDGHSTRILEDAWLPTRDLSRIETSVLGIAVQPVCALFRDGQRAWDEDVIYDLFSVKEAAIILGIPLSENEVGDSWYWSKELDGSYSVKTAYRLCYSLSQPAHDNDNSSFWLNLWQINIPPKVKNFIWRASSNILPTKLNLRGKSVDIDPRCVFCGIFGESTFHCLFACEFAMECWSMAGDVVDGEGVVSVRGWLEKAITISTKVEVAQIFMIAWAVWCARNDVVWQQRKRPAMEVVAFAKTQLSQWLKTQGHEGYPSLNPLFVGDGRELWSKPVGEEIKVNVDAAIFIEEASFGFCFVARDCQGRLVAARACHKLGEVTPFLAEAMGLKEALSWIQSLGSRSVVLESDCLGLVEAVRNGISMRSTVGLVVEECQVLFNSLSNVTLLFVKRSANRAAHCLARQSRCYVDRMFDEGYVPPILLDVLNQDLH